MRAARIVLVAWTTGQQLLAGGQTFNRRYDTFGQGLPQVAWAIEKGEGDTYVLMNSGSYTDSIMYWTTFSTIRISSTGEKLEEHAYPEYYNSTYAGFVNSSERLPDGGYIVGGSRYGPNTDGYTRLVRLGPDLDTLWIRIYGDSGTEWIGRSAIRTPDDGFLVCGETSSIGVLDAFVIKTDAYGNEIWRRTYGDPQLWDSAECLASAADGNFFVGGEKQWSSTNKQFRVLKLSSAGDSIWSNEWGGPYDDAGARVSMLSNGNVSVAGSWGFAPQFSLTQAYMAELDQNDGAILWERWYGPIVDRTTLWVPKEVAPGQGCIVAGFDFEANSINFYRGILLRTAANGDSLWMRSYFYYDSLMTNGKGEFKDVIPTDDHGFIACGDTHGAYMNPYPPGYNQDVWVVKVDSLGCIVEGCDAVGVEAQVTNLKGVLTLWPVPLSSSKGQSVLNISIHLPANFKTEGPLILSVTDPEGKLVMQQLVPTTSVDGLEVDVSSLATGSYSMHLSDAHTWIAGKKFVID